MFQVAVASIIAKNNNTKLQIDISRLLATSTERFSRSVGITDFKLEGVEIDLMSAPVRVGLIKKTRSRILQKINNHYHSYNEKIMKSGANSILEGYFQSKLYFTGNEQFINNLFKIKSHFRTSYVRQVEADMLQNNSVSIHVRRGDYTSDPKIAKLHHICNGNYYQKIIDLLEARDRDLKWYVFSDDPTWTLKNLNFNSPCTHISGASWLKDMPPAVELHLMSHARHHILSNSTFSWWGACLKQQSGNVFSPSMWNRNPRFNNVDDMTMEDWTLVDV